MKTRTLLKQRGQLALVGFGLWFLLALWSITAFWSHIDRLEESYNLGAKCGALAGEFALLAMVFWHCFNRHINVRRWSLIFGFILGVTILLHAGALRGMDEAEVSRRQTEDRLTEALTKMSAEQSAAIPDSRSRGGRREAARTRAQIATGAQQQVAEVIKERDQIIRSSSLLPRWYLDKWCYSVIFIASLALIGILTLMMMNRDDVDEDFDGVPDHRQRSSEFPSELEEKQVMFITPDCDSSTTVGRLSDFDRKRALQILRDHLREIAPKGNWFKADLIEGGVNIRQYEWDRGNEQTIASTKQSNKLLRAVEREGFRARLRDELSRRGFQLRKEI